MTPRLRPLAQWFLFTGLLLGGAGPLAAQHVLCVEYKGKPAVVRKVVNGYPFVMDGSKLVSVSAGGSALVPVKEFLPAFVTVRQMDVRTSHLELVGSGAELNQAFHLATDLESPFALPNVFIVLDLDSERGGKAIFYHGIGDLEPRQAKHLDVSFPLAFALGEGKYQLHIFADGVEVLHSQQPWQYREGALDRMVLKRVEGVTDAPPKPFVGPVPEYPTALRKAGTKGEVTVKVKLTARGVVVDPVVESATDPAFGEAALAAVRMWRFLPKMKNGRPVETRVSMPFIFTPPADTRS